MAKEKRLTRKKRESVDLDGRFAERVDNMLEDASENMNCTLGLTADGDRAYWIRRDALIACDNDLHMRASAVVEDFYSAECFAVWPDGLRRFTPAAFYLQNDTVLFIGGRHRTVVLSRYMDLLPMTLTKPQQDHPVFRRLAVREILMDEVIWLPDLPTRYEHGGS